MYAARPTWIDLITLLSYVLSILPRSFSSPTPEKTFVYSFLTLPIILTPPVALTSPPPLPPLLRSRLHFATPRPSSVLQ
jgi:hypothetical protein